MIILEFVIFVVSSGLFCSERFRNHVWAVIVAGAIATGSSLLFMYDLGARFTGHPKEPPVITKIVKQTVVKEVQTNQNAAAASKHNCAKEYPADALQKGLQGVTGLSFKILTDGTVDTIKVLASSGSDKLDEAAVKCVSNWHYRPAIKNGKLAETSWKTEVHWVLPSHDDATKGATETAAADTPKPADPPKKAEDSSAPKEEAHESRPWYDIGGWFASSDSEKKPPQQTP